MCDLGLRTQINTYISCFYYCIRVGFGAFRPLPHMSSFFDAPGRNLVTRMGRKWCFLFIPSLKIGWINLSNVSGLSLCSPFLRFLMFFGRFQVGSFFSSWTNFQILSSISLNLGCQLAFLFKIYRKWLGKVFLKIFVSWRKIMIFH